MSYAIEIRADDALPQLDRLLPLPHVIALTGLSKSTIYREVRAGRFPKPVAISAGRVAWPSRPVRDWQRRCFAAAA